MKTNENLSALPSRFLRRNWRYAPTGHLDGQVIAELQNAVSGRLDDICLQRLIGEQVERPTLTELQNMMGPPEDGPRKKFGGLYDMLAVEPCPEEARPFRTILHQHIRETWPFGPGDEILGDPQFGSGSFQQAKAG
ncbi:hypothetical protein [Paracoccus beibuensis]|uniref:hypothetical protein n=1 Tax=Paracoccus beibuensis TaxID=547602 RepID=UPI00223F54E9|nr:hypothetical protein [Paracoccus beibuensis]